MEDLFPGLTQEEQDEFEPEVVLFARYLVAGTLENIDGIDDVIAAYSVRRAFDRIDVIDRNILRISVFSLFFSEDTHPHVIIDEAVKLSQEFSSEVNYRFINGLLDALMQELSAYRTTYPDVSTDKLLSSFVAGKKKTS
ncbi:NusB antitermination factor [Parasphaerochaeta coccoides DSM 17374]|uniref:NusB antitermination factor n=2 Tax=Parasphaerochaeta TaxID=3062336 RepID=F4GJ66_PARC1|nr:NusB antitermination factor [Parasphaerochaeta coccoides DSM 17374]